MNSFLIILGLAVAALVSIVRNSSGYASYRQSIEKRTDAKSLPVALIEKEESDNSDNEEQIFPYTRRPLLTVNERNFYGILADVVGDRYVLFTQVSLSRLMNVSRAYWWQKKYRNKIALKSVDFVLCDPDSFSVELIIELDDASHDREERQERDAFVDQALSAAGLHCVHIRARRNYYASEIENILREYI